MNKNTIRFMCFGALKADFLSVLCSGVAFVEFIGKGKRSCKPGQKAEPQCLGWVGLADELAGLAWPGLAGPTRAAVTASGTPAAKLAHFASPFGLPS